MGFLAQLPSTDPAETMSPPEFRETLRRHLGVERPASAAARCPKCHKPVESDALFQLLKQVAHLRGLDRDTLAPFRRYAARHGFNKFKDIVFGSNQICLPVPKVQPSADAAQRGARDVQRVLESASQEKIDTYVVSGALQSSQGSYNLAQRVAFWRRRTSLALQRALTRVVIDNWNAVIAPDGDQQQQLSLSLLPLLQLALMLLILLVQLKLLLLVVLVLQLSLLLMVKALLMLQDIVKLLLPLQQWSVRRAMVTLAGWQQVSLPPAPLCAAATDGLAGNLLMTFQPAGLEQLQ
ncbi:hypothetical protein JKP88DRAFT_283111 [Tribonema minus]|uniref:Uncharacterized protein n=1 Tax=Tribonema minus TaxID=303371 RepID=A0A836C8R0_9STRA|nr:hypothetical protein JKP88DRAFT_283111 [Tribonema minus]